MEPIGRDYASFFVCLYIIIIGNPAAFTEWWLVKSQSQRPYILTNFFFFYLLVLSSIFYDPYIVRDYNHLYPYITPYYAISSHWTAIKFHCFVSSILLFFILRNVRCGILDNAHSQLITWQSTILEIVQHMVDAPPLAWLQLQVTWRMKNFPWIVGVPEMRYTSQLLIIL